MRFYVADSEILLDSESSLDSILGLPVKISCVAHSLEMSLGGGVEGLRVLTCPPKGERLRHSLT